MRLYLHHRPDSGATEVCVEVGVDWNGWRLFQVREDPVDSGMRLVSVAPGAEGPLYCPPIPDAEMARLLGIQP